MERVILIRNLHCANCARELQEELEALKDIHSVTVDFINQRVKLSHETPEAFERAIALIAGFEEVEIIDGNAPRKRESRRKEILSIAFSVAFFLPALLLQIFQQNEWLVFSLFVCSFLAAGWSVVFSVGKNLKKSFTDGFRLGVLLDENTLMLIASIGAFAILESMEGAAVMLLYQIGELLQSIAVGSSRNAIEKLMELKSDCALLLEGDGTREVAPEALKAGDLIALRRGDKLSADCILTEGETQLDTKSLTGESLLREVRAGEEMLAGCVIEGNAVVGRVVRPSSESAVAKILNLVENASSQKAKPEKFITRFARFYTPIVVCLALFVAFVPPIFYGYTAEAFTRWLISALNFLVISCPCALIISVPLTYFSGVGTLAKHGVLAKGAVHLDTLAQVKVAAFDKTGTLTEGKFSVVNCVGRADTLSLAASLEKRSAHPLAQAFYGVEAPLAEEVNELAGLGVEGVVNGKRVLVGSEKLFAERKLAFEKINSQHAVAYVAEEGQFVGAVEIADRVKGEAKHTLAALKSLGIAKTAMLTGDNASRANTLAEALALDEVHAELLPAQKLERATALKEEGTLLYVGDGVNDTPVMTVADVAVSMGSLGSDAAIEASDMVLVSDDLSALPKAIRAAKKTRKIVFENVVFSIAVKFALMLLSVFGLLPLSLAVFGDVGVMLLAVLNSMRMRAKLK